MTQQRLVVVPITIGDEKLLVKRLHRHHVPPQGGLFAVAVAIDGAEEPCGVAIVGRPVSRALDDGWTAEVARVATDGTPNACSCLYGACWRAGKAMGYRRMVTYTLQSEPGTSLVAAGWRVVGEVKGKTWNVPSRPRVDKHPLQNKFRWEPVS